MLRVRASALNRLDLNLPKGYQGSLPRIMGCDIAGEVVQISPEANTGLKEGDRVLLDNWVRCGVCESCVQSMNRYCAIRSDWEWTWTAVTPNMLPLPLSTPIKSRTR
jgi:NADPH:quinone reductase-like Zn-dependent oxidoreductase